MDNIHKKEDDGCHERNKDPHDSHVGPNNFANAEYLVNNPLETRHVTLLDELVLQYPVLNLFLREVDVVGEQL